VVRTVDIAPSVPMMVRVKLPYLGTSHMNGEMK